MATAMAIATAQAEVGMARGGPNRRVEYVEIQCKSLLNRVNVPYLSFRWSVNPYSGCVHGCVYCYARRYHEYRELDPFQGFQRQVFVKVNAVEVLRRELSRKRWRRELVAVGTAADAYQPAEGKYRLTRGILETLAEFRTPCSITTKNTMVVRDVDVLRQLAAGPGVRVYFTITTVDEELARRIEPDTPPPSRRLAALERLAAAGIPVSVLIMPIMPGLNDDPASLEAVIRAAAQHGARSVHGGVLRLQGAVRQVYGRFLLADSPWLLPLYRRLYPGAYAPVWYQNKVLQRVAELKARYGFDADTARCEETRGSSDVRPEASASAGAPAAMTACRLLQLTLF
ncbi:MAG: radical SAM protein [Limnochordales bacterium]